MDLEMLIKLKRSLGYSNKVLAEKSGVPLSTVQKVMSGMITSPRRKTVEALTHVLLEEQQMETHRYTASRQSAEAEQDDKPYSISPEGLLTKRVDEWDPSVGTFMVREEAIAYGKKRKYTMDDIRALPDGVRAELIDGQLYFMATPTRTHQRITGGMHLSVANYLREHGKDCEVYIPPYAVWPMGEDGDYLEPDLTVICDHSKSTEDGCVGAPDWVVEVLSPSTRRKDLTLKLSKYAAAGVRLYWIIDPKKNVVLVYDNAGDTVDIYSFEDEIPCALCPELKIRVADML